MVLVFFGVLFLSVCLQAKPIDNETLLKQFSERVQKHFEEIHKNSTDEPKGIWYPNYLSTLLDSKGWALDEEAWTGWLEPSLFTKTGNWTHYLNSKDHAHEKLESLIYRLSILDCGNVSQLVYYLAIGDVVGKERFNAYVLSNPKPLFIGQYDDDAPTNSLLLDFLLPAEIPLPGSIDHRPLEIGQLTYFVNKPDYLKRHPKGVAQGYNTVYVGKDDQGHQLFSGLWYEPAKTEAGVIALLDERYNCPPDKWDLAALNANPDPSYAPNQSRTHECFKHEGIYTFRLNLSLLQAILSDD